MLQRKKKQGAANAKLFLSASAASGIFLAICTIRGGSLVAGGSWWRAAVQQLDLLYSGRFLGP